MNRLILIVLTVHCFCSAPAFAGDYLLRVDTIGFTDRPKSDKAPTEKILHRMETVVRAGTMFHSKVRIGRQTILLHGELHPTDDGNFKVRIQYAHVKDPGMTVVAEDGGAEPVVDECSLSTTVTVSPGTPVLIGGMQTVVTETTPAGEITRASEIQHVLNLTEYTEPPTVAE